MTRPSSEVLGVAGGVSVIALVAVCCAIPVLAPIGLVIGAGVGGTAAILRVKRRRRN